MVDVDDILNEVTGPKKVTQHTVKITEGEKAAIRTAIALHGSKKAAEVFRRYLRAAVVELTSKHPKRSA